MSETVILLDLDGPVVDCVGDVFERYGVPRQAQRTRCTTYDALTEFLCARASTTDPWADLGCNREFWARMTTQPWGERLIRKCQEIAPTVICTKPLAYAECAAGKVDWCLRRGLDFVLVRGGAQDKGVLASPRHVLVDDAEHQVEAFRAAGGRAVLWPAPWNSRGDALEYGIDVVLSEIRGVVAAEPDWCPL